MVAAYSGGLSSQQQRQVRAQKARDVQTLYENEHKRVMRELGAAIKKAKGEERAELQRLRDACTVEREVVSKAAQEEFEASLALAKKRRADYLDAIRKDYRATLARLAEERAALLREAREKAKQRRDLAGLWPEIWRGEQITAKAEFEQWLIQAREARAETIRRARSECLARGSTALSQAIEKLKSLVSDQDERKADRRMSKAMSKPAKGQKPKITTSQRRREQREESDDEVRSNIPPELVPIFEHVKKQVTGNQRQSRTEHFLELYEEDKGNLDAWLAAEQEKLDEKRLASEMERWYEEQQAQTAYVEAQRAAEIEEEKRREAKATKKARKAIQTQFTSKSGRGIAEKKTNQKELLEDVSDAYLPPDFVPNVDAFNFEAFGSPL